MEVIKGVSKIINPDFMKRKSIWGLWQIIDEENEDSDVLNVL